MKPDSTSFSCPFHRISDFAYLCTQQNNICMKRILLIGFVAAFCICGHIHAQNSATDLMKQAQENLNKQSYTTARYLFLKAYNAFVAEGNYEQAVICSVNASALYHRENYYKEAFQLLANAEQTVAASEKRTGKELPALRYPIIKERLRMYLNIGKTGNAKTQLDLLEDAAQKAAGDSLKTDLLYTKTAYFYTLRQNAKGDATIKQLIEESCRIQAAEAQSKYDTLKQQYDASLLTIDEKESSLSTKQYFIVSLCILSVILAAALIFTLLILLRCFVLTRKQKKTIEVANQHNELKTQFIQNISTQMDPTLATLDNRQPGVQALREFTRHIQELSDLEQSLSEPYESEEKNVNTFCEGIMAQIQKGNKKDLVFSVNAPKLGIKICSEPLQHILLHLLENAVRYTPDGGKVTLDFKKRGAHTHQFIVTDTGCGISEEQRNHLFKPFSEIRDLTQGDGLGLPICSLMAIRMNGTLTLDEGYTKGARFILELHA